MAVRRARAVLPYCSTCRTRYRGIYPVHASTQRHQAIARRGRGGRKNISDLNKSLGIARLHVGRALAGDSGDTKVKVRKHRRRRPLDGPAFVVGIRRHWREPPAVLRVASYIPRVVRTVPSTVRKVVPW